jgi:type II secretory pathway pseudopilin PulG
MNMSGLRQQYWRGVRVSANSDGFTLVEALVAMSITVMAASLILLATETSLRTSDDAVDKTIAAGMAQQLIDEIIGQRYRASGVTPYEYPLGPNSWESQGQGRERYDDTDDYHGFKTRGAKDIWNQPLGEGDDAGGLRHPQFRVRAGYFDKWRQEVEVYYVSNNNPSVRLSAYQTSDFRAVEVTISREMPDGTLRPLAKLRRVYAYVSPPN